MKHLPPCQQVFYFFSNAALLGKNSMHNAGCPLNRARPVWHYFDFFVRLASASVPSEALTLISRQSLHAEDGLRMDVFTFGIWEYVLCKKRFLKSSFKSSGGIGQFSLNLISDDCFLPARP